MENRFRFRVWDCANKRYIERHTYRETFMITQFSELTMLSKLGKLRRDVDLRFFVEQCTGIPDSTGMLIYEGDILKTEGPGPENRLVVMWNNTFCGFTLENTRKGGISLNTLMYARDMKIIGNVRENHEMIFETVAEE